MILTVMRTRANEVCNYDLKLSVNMPVNNYSLVINYIVIIIGLILPLCRGSYNAGLHSEGLKNAYNI
jgi:hypothetical protein